MPRRKKPDKPTPRGGALRYLRTARGVPEKELARREGVSPSVIAELEHGVRELTRERLDDLLAHLDVPPEAADAALLARELTEPPPPPASPVDPTEEEYRALHRAAIRSAGATLEAIRSDLVKVLRERRTELDRRQAGELWEAVKALKPARRRQTVLEEARFWTWAFAERLCEESRRMAAHSADDALALAELALSVAERAVVPETWRPFLLGYSWAFIGNARRVKGNLPFADGAFRQADEHWQNGASSPLPLDATRLLELKASLRKYQERYAESIALLEQAAALCRTQSARARVLIMKATTLELQGAYGQAVKALLDAESEAVPGKDLETLFSIRFNLAVNMLHLGQRDDVEALMPEVRGLAMVLGSGLHLTRVVWLSGRFAAVKGEIDEALTALEQVRWEFTHRAIAYDAALVSLEVAVLLLRRNQTEEVRSLARGMAWIFKSQGLHVHALAALKVFCQAAIRQVATVDLAEQAYLYLEKARHNPQLRFDENFVQSN